MAAKVSIQGMPTEAIIDTGSGISIIGGHFYDTFAKPMESCHDISNIPSTTVAANGQPMTTRGVVALNITLGDRTVNHFFHIIEELKFEVILGNDLLHSIKAEIDVHQGRLSLEGSASIPVQVMKHYQALSKLQPTFSVKVAKTMKIPSWSAAKLPINITGELEQGETYYIQEDSMWYDQRGLYLLPGVIEVKKGVIESIEVINPKQQPAWIYEGELVGEMQQVNTTTISNNEGNQELIGLIQQQQQPSKSAIIDQINQLDLSKDTDFTIPQQQQFRDFLKKNIDMFAVDPKCPGTNTQVKHHIDTGEHPPIKQHPYRSSFKENEIIQKEVKTMLQNNTIRPSRSPWSSPVVLVTKKDGTTRFCVDYRKLNAITKKDVYPLPRIDDTLDKLQGMKYFSSLDLASGYWQVEIEEKDKEKTAFICKEGLYEFNVMPFGLCNAPATFQRLMNEVLSQITPGIVKDYMDDILICSQTFEKHLQDIQQVFDYLQAAHLTIKFSKCNFFKKKLIFLGHEVSEEGIHPDQNKVEVIKRMAIPVDIHGLRRFLGLTSYY